MYSWGPCEAATVAKKEEHVMDEGQLIAFLIRMHANDYGTNDLPGYYVYLECVLHAVEIESELLQRTNSRASTSCDHPLCTYCLEWLQQLHCRSEQ